MVHPQIKVNLNFFKLTIIFMK